MTTTDILKKVRELEIKSKRLTNHLFTGEYHTAFKGRGMSFKEVREYYAGDDPRFIDWNVTARMGNHFISVNPLVTSNRVESLGLNCAP